MNQASAPEYAFDRPVIIVAAPRSGSTLLFETLSRAASLWSIGDESHAVFERIEKLNPVFGICASNRLDAGDADDGTVSQIRESFMRDLRNADGVMFDDARPDAAPRLLEKTPKNALRIPFLLQLFPDARFIYLFRDPRENLGSLIEGWRSSRFVTYRNLPGWPGPWSFLLPPGYEQLRGRRLEEVVAFQWRAVNEFILDDLAGLPDERWTALSYAELLGDTPATVERLCRFADIPFDDGLRAHCERELRPSRYTMTPPQPGKWRRNEAMIERVMPGLQPLIARIGDEVAARTSAAVLHTGPVAVRMSRNAPCHCGSGLRFKACHGKLGAADTGPAGTNR